MFKRFFIKLTWFCHIFYLVSKVRAKTFHFKDKNVNQHLYRWGTSAFFEIILNL